MPSLACDKCEKVVNTVTIYQNQKIVIIKMFDMLVKRITLGDFTSLKPMPLMMPTRDLYACKIGLFLVLIWIFGSTCSFPKTLQFI